MRFYLEAIVRACRVQLRLRVRTPVWYFFFFLPHFFFFLLSFFSLSFFFLPWFLFSPSPFHYPLQARSATSMLKHFSSAYFWSPNFTVPLPLEDIKLTWRLGVVRRASFELRLNVKGELYEWYRKANSWKYDKKWAPSFFVTECRVSVLHPKTDEVLHTESVSSHWVVLESSNNGTICSYLLCCIDRTKKRTVTNTLTVQVSGDILCFPCPDHRDKTVPLDNIRAELYSLFEESAYTDVTIKCGGEEFKAHKAVLASQSPVFKTMFEVDMKEKDSNIIEISDIDATVMSDLMAYFYKGKPLHLNTLAKDLLNAANKYELPRLFAMCENELTEDLKAENLVETLVWADLHNAKTMKQKCARYYQQNASRVRATSGWKHLKDNMDKYSALLMELLEFTD